MLVEQHQSDIEIPIESLTRNGGGRGSVEVFRVKCLESLSLSAKALIDFYTDNHND